MQKQLLPESASSEAKKRSNKSNCIATFLLIFIIIVYLLVNLRWISLNNAPPLDDDNQNLIKTILHYNSLSEY